MSTPQGGKTVTKGFSAGLASRLSEVPYRTLDYWAISGFLPPSCQVARGKGSMRAYTFRDLVQLRVAKRMRDAGISLQGLRKVKKCLQRQFNFKAPFAEAYLVTNGQDVFEVKKDREEVWSLLSAPGQRTHPWILLNLAETASEVDRAAKAEERLGKVA